MKKFRVVLIFLCLAGAGLCLAAGPPADAFKALPRVFASGMRITPYLRYQIEAAWRQDDLRRACLAAVRDETDLLQLQRDLRSKLIAALGGLPETKTQLNARVTGSVQLEGYRVEKVIFESLPGFQVTALLYLPEGAPGPRPAVLVACGHSPIGKAHPGYQQIAGRLARRGYVVLCWDPVGQGERSQYWDAARGDSRYNRICGEHAILGNLACLAGTSLARWEVWDGIRAFDYLLTRPEVDSTRISVTGTSGGGFQSAFLGALDTRIRVSLPSCYICSMPMRMANRIYADPDTDPEQDLYRMLSDGIDHAGLLVLTWPRPVAVSAAVLDFFPIEGTRKTFREVVEVYRKFGLPERIALTEGYHVHSFSGFNQEFAFAFLDRFNGLDPRWSLDSVKVLGDRELWCTRSGQVRLDFPEGRSLPQLIREYWQQRKASATVTLAQMYRGYGYPGIETWPVKEYKGAPPRAGVAWEKTGGSEFEGVAIDRYVLHHSGGMVLPLLDFHRPGAGPGRVLFWFKAGGKAAPGDWAEVKSFLDQGWRVVSFDSRARGEDRLDFQVASIDDPALARVDLETQYASPLSGVLANYVYNSLLIGRPYFLELIEDAEIASRFAREKLGATALSVTSSGEGYTLAVSISETLPGVKLLARPGEKALLWSELVDTQSESWPIQYLLPGGAFVR
jgi:hypothetical protein